MTPAAFGTALASLSGLEISHVIRKQRDLVERMDVLEAFAAANNVSLERVFKDGRYPCGVANNQLVYLEGPYGHIKFIIQREWAILSRACPGGPQTPEDYFSLYQETVIEGIECASRTYEDTKNTGLYSKQYASHSAVKIRDTLNMSLIEWFSKSMVWVQHDELVRELIKNQSNCLHTTLLKTAIEQVCQSQDTTTKVHLLSKLIIHGINPFIHPELSNIFSFEEDEIYSSESDSEVATSHSSGISDVDDMTILPSVVENFANTAHFEDPSMDDMFVVPTFGE